ncbi:MAG: adenine-specific methyltransferase EcoRI family protein, partial [Bacteroidaceae bacterium]
LDDLQWDYLDGDGDFRSKEVTRLRDEADIIVTNPPFSLFREFVAWIMEAHKEFVVIGNQNAITYKEIFPLLMHNQIWLGVTGFSRDMVFGVPEGTIVKESDKKKAERLGYVGNYTRLGNSCWFTNIEHGRRHQLKWVSKGRVEDYMQEHRWDANINELKNHFNDVINWIESIFDEVYPQMKGLNWGELYDRFHNNPYNHIEVSQKVRDLLCDPCVGDRKNVFEYVLGGSGDTKLLNIRVFEESTKHRVYDRQTKEAKASGISNCPLCAIGHDANRQRIWKLTDMDADHVRAWSKGGATEESNCQMLCRTHNRAKGNR